MSLVASIQKNNAISELKLFSDKMRNHNLIFFQLKKIIQGWEDFMNAFLEERRGIFKWQKKNLSEKIFSVLSFAIYFAFKLS